MEKYIINNKTVALLKKNKSTIIYNVDNKYIINKHIKKILNDNCLINGCSMEGRIKAAKKILNKAYKIPLKINDNIILIQLNSLRKEECLLIVLNKILDYQVENNNLKITLVNNKKFYYKISKNNFENLIINAFKLNNYFKYKKY